MPFGLFAPEHFYEEFVDTKRVIKIRKTKKDREHNDQTMIYKTLHRKLRIR